MNIDFKNKNHIEDLTKDEFSELDDEHPIFQVFMEVNKVFIAKL